VTQFEQLGGEYSTRHEDEVEQYIP